jgi:hypothetical protein
VTKRGIEKNPTSDRHKSGPWLVFYFEARTHQLRWIIAINKLDSTSLIVMETESATSQFTCGALAFLFFYSFNRIDSIVA